MHLYPSNVDKMGSDVHELKSEIDMIHDDDELQCIEIMRTWVAFFLFHTEVVGVQQGLFMWDFIFQYDRKK